MTDRIGLVVGSYMQEAAPNLVRVVCKAHIRTFTGDAGDVRYQLCQVLDCAAAEAVTFDSDSPACGWTTGRGTPSR